MRRVIEESKIEAGGPDVRGARAARLPPHDPRGARAGEGTGAGRFTSAPMARSKSHRQAMERLVASLGLEAAGPVRRRRFEAAYEAQGRKIAYAPDWLTPRNNRPRKDRGSVSGALLRDSERPVRSISRRHDVCLLAHLRNAGDFPSRAARERAQGEQRCGARSRPGRRRARPCRPRGRGASHPAARSHRRPAC